MSNTPPYLPSQPHLTSLTQIKNLETQLADQAAQHSTSEQNILYAHGRQHVDFVCKIADLEERVRELKAALKATKVEVAALEKEVDEYEKEAAAREREQFGSQTIRLDLDSMDEV